MSRMIVCLCGSTNFKETFEEINKQETLNGNIVLSVGWYGHCDPTPLTIEQKKALDELHLDKIRMSHLALFLNVGGYLGDSSLDELDFCCLMGVPFSFLEPNNLSERTKEVLKSHGMVRVSMNTDALKKWETIDKLISYQKDDCAIL